MDRIFRAHRPHQGSHYPQSYTDGTLGASWPTEASTPRRHDGASHHRRSTTMSYATHGSHNRRLSLDQVEFINDGHDEAIALLEVAKEAVLVLRMRNAITQLADIVDLYDAADRATGCKAIITRDARR